ncbi:UNVERIFIED_CONTAM: hypothetical protein Sradi_0478600 [Sesamum radiatum]|uniref:Integrase catalytic domain-containing protein n=1 Tax=Sesamum radiatum TaxID=300843 RepID=A0AAW2W804_SESRA
MALALVVTARRLRPYFLSHPIGVKTNTPLKQTLGKPETSARLVKWAIELREYDISYVPRTTINAQALADFEMAGMSVEDTSQNQMWLLHVDGHLRLKTAVQALSSHHHRWWIDIVGSFPEASSQRKFLLVAIDYFAKWVEAEPLARITEGEVMKLIWNNIVCHFGIPREIISNNGRQFQGRRIQEWCQELHIKQRFTSVAHPQSNGQVEVTNRILMQGIKRKLERVGGNWTEELTSVLWAYMTIPRGSTGESPFSLVYGIEAIIPTELGIPSHRVMNFFEICNKDLLKESLDLIEELREKALIRIQRYKNTMINSYNKRVRAQSF